MKTKALLFGVALFIRIIALWILPEPHLPTNATLAYMGGARILVEGKGFSDPFYPIFTPPLYAVFISILWSLFGVDQVSIKLAQALADSVTVIVIYLIVQELFNVRTALLSAAIWAVYPFAIYPTIYIGTETLFTFFLSLFVLLTVHGNKYGKWQYASGAGVMLGLATLTRGTTQFLPFLFPLALFALKKNKNRWLLNYGTFLLAFALVLLPWGLRNYLIFHEFIPVATASGVFLWGSTEKFLTIEERERELPVFFDKLRSRGLEQPSKGSNPAQ
ncbi:MAG: glycosyltransferase family 39 protein, partial [Nitrososphaera sp.]|nr:glycosyltransferase family 39 protein [Nitrososphaera sp.]